MNIRRSAILHSLLLASLLFTSRGHADDVKMNMPAGNFAHRIGWGPIDDPSGASHSSRELAGKVVVAIFSVPDMSQGPAQRRWSNLLASDPETKVPDEVALVLFENISAAGPFKDEALDDMKKQFEGKKRPFLLLDETGDTFRKFGILRDRTEILIFDKHGNLRDVEQNLGDRDETVQHIKAITGELLK